jgi:quinol monooxygenase YgiN
VIGERIRSEQEGSVTVVTHVDVVPPEKDNAVLALDRLARESRQHAGNLRFDVWQQTNRPNHLTVVEGWASRPALDEHAMASQTRAFRTSLSAMTGALYDDRWYAALR